jgi:Na+-translocating ferredoxin:NAD+ oxidoreductase RnfC subunit
LVLIVGVSLVLVACDDDPVATPSEQRITTVDELLARACELAADCVDATQEQIDACPANLGPKLDAQDIAVLEQFTTLDKSRQDEILDCFDSKICGRFGGALTSISDSDLMEPLVDCQR